MLLTNPSPLIWSQICDAGLAVQNGGRSPRLDAGCYSFGGISDHAARQARPVRAFQIVNRACFSALTSPSKGPAFVRLIDHNAKGIDERPDLPGHFA